VGRFLFGGWIVGRTTPLHMVGSSSGAWRFAAAAQVDPKVVLDWLPRKDLWAGLKTIAKVTPPAGGQRKKTFTETAYLISSLENHTPTIGKAIRDHWDIENSLYRCLDVASPIYPSPGGGRPPAAAA
jgi:hypothetical protein